MPSFCFYGGEKEIRTLVGVLAQTRFPVVRLRPTQPSLRADPEILSQNYPFVKSFFLFCFKSSQNIPRSSPQTSFFFVFLLKSLDKKRKGRYNTLNRWGRRVPDRNRFKESRRRCDRGSRGYGEWASKGEPNATVSRLRRVSPVTGQAYHVYAQRGMFSFKSGGTASFGFVPSILSILGFFVFWRKKWSLTDDGDLAVK